MNTEANKNKYTSELQPNGKVTLSIDDCVQEDAGEITIIAENRAGSTQCSAELVVERKSDFWDVEDYLRFCFSL